MMTETRKTEIEIKLNYVIEQLKEAQKSLRNQQYIHASIYIDNAHNQLPTMRHILATQH